ncbi:MAG: recombination regulator RecX [Gemmatimonadota bacterium]|nr:recombination regulator RecX [Gemmatimonadota bacterium]
MAKITGISAAKRRSGWVEIELDGASSVLLPRDRLFAHALREGEEIAERRLEELREAAERAEAMRIALSYLSARPRSRQEVARKLREKEVGGAVGETTLVRCEELGYLDDVAFAAAFARDRIRLRPCGVRRLQSDLRGKGVLEGDALAGIEQAMRDEKVTEPELLERVAERRARSLRAVDPEVANRRLFAFLTRRGFDATEVRRWIESEKGDSE